jgi:hypothetical protein
VTGPAFPGVPDFGEPVVTAAAAGGRAALACQKCCRNARSAARRCNEYQCWVLAQITEVVRRRFAVECTLAGMDLLHRIGRSMQVLSRRGRKARGGGDCRLAGGG